MRNEKNLKMHELIGLYVKVEESTNPNQKGIEGRIVDETYHMLVIETPKGEKMIMKKGAKFRIKINGKDVIINGDSINYRPHERIKKLIRRKGK
ncbi:MAG: ribonuclease P protein subunit [Thermoplasmata archaeon]|uniref:Ribonuclease P protein component 1 n=1 Tax=Candidatus Aciduliprofundum boonei TaxID=379547 RepID=A0A7J3TA80_9ARCH|nr:ribonuclease P protein subunit [Thermoplasmata archaeon]HHE75834.1 ribonuclease P protein subunit [Candidatus Aciduliprofundum boonei]